ncbi:MAG: hypothetical protein EP319_10555 [Deltaproteobacteria bacterium]|jgi:hypothetical protein|nr:MAG: hypothetical protein EP319_10555 [Deltaproteobacteria bacterium]
MKSLVALLILLLSLSGFNASGSEFRRIADYPVLEEVLDFVNEASYDLDSYFKMEETESLVFDGMNCSEISAKELHSFIKKEFKKVQDFYPEEGIPFRKALSELDQLLGGNKYLKCERVEDKDKYQIISHFFQSVEEGLPSFKIEFEKRL